HNWSYNLTIYEVNVRQYTASGTFTEFATHLDRLKELGVGILWFMPIHPIGLQNRLGSLGSYYSVKDYYGVNPEFGTLADFKALVDSIHSKGMYVLMDWVANHTSWDNALTTVHPEWYVKDGNGNFIPPPGTNWSDVIQLDYSKPELRTYMIEAMKYWIDSLGVDGFRCDAVSFMPLDFWSNAIVDLKNTKPGIFMLAEDNGAQYNTAGFDMTYAWGLYGFGNGILINIVAGTNNANVLNTYTTQENIYYPAPYYRMYFTSNHDENSWYGTVYELFGDAAEVFAVLTSTFRSMPLIYSGQEAGLNHRLAFFDKDQITWQPHPFTDMYKKLFHLKRNNKALWNGSAGGQLQRVTTTNNPAIFSFVRQKDDCKIFAIFNLTTQEQTVTLQGTLYPGIYRDVFTDDSVSFTENTDITLPAWGYKVYEFGSGITEVKYEESIPDQYLLSQNFPNPFNPTTRIIF
ncbi:MAG: alpha-amylase family glycosyl hydrolase, partial [Ignavibacteria bacterium]|nr:alpha-amylase family glycosyl hydrolase [Ignavibacteria bacterium]